MNTNELLKRLQAKKCPVLAADKCGPAQPRPPIKPRQPSYSALVELLRRQQERIAAKAAEHGQERKASGGNQTEGCIKGESAAALPPDALQGAPLSDREREDIAAGLTPAQARRAAEARVDTLEWLLGLERMTQEQAERVASFRRMDAALISARGKMPCLDSLGIPRFPPDCDTKYRHWEDGQPLLDTLLELRAQDWAIDSRVTQERSPDDWWRWQEIRADACPTTLYFSSS